MVKGNAMVKVYSKGVYIMEVNNVMANAMKVIEGWSIKQMNKINNK